MSSKIVSHKILKKSGTFIRKEWLIFLWCFLLAIIFWLLQAMEEIYVEEVQMKIQYENLPEERIFTEPLPDYLYVEVEAPGWQLAGNFLGGQGPSIIIDYLELGQQDFYLPRENIATIQEALPAEAELLNVYPDTLYFEHEPLVKKDVPVEPNLSLDFQSGYGMSGPIQMAPDTVEAQGAQNEIEKLEKVRTDSISREKLNSDLEKEVKLLSPSRNLYLSPDQVDIFIPVERLTEKQIQQEVTVRNRVEQYELRLMPSRVSLTFKVPLSLYEEIGEDDFELYVDARKAYQDSLNRLPLELDQKPEYIQALHKEPEFLDYYINLVQ